MPIGVLINTLSVVLGGVLGTLFGGKLSRECKEKLNMVFGSCSMAMGISSIVLMENMPAVVFSVITGTAFGLALHLGAWIDRGAAWMQKAISKVLPVNSGLSKLEYNATLVTAIVLFCASGTGIYGSIVAGMTGDHSILIAKSILDLFTSFIFACFLGAVVSVIALPQMVIFLALFACAGVIFPLTTPAMINDFKACGGVLLLCTGFRIIKVKPFPIADMIPAMVLVMPVSRFWTTCIAPLVNALAG